MIDLTRLHENCLNHFEAAEPIELEVILRVLTARLLRDCWEAGIHCYSAVHVLEAWRLKRGDGALGL